VIEKYALTQRCHIAGNARGVKVKSSAVPRINARRLHATESGATPGKSWGEQGGALAVVALLALANRSCGDTPDANTACEANF